MTGPIIDSSPFGPLQPLADSLKAMAESVSLEDILSGQCSPRITEGLVALVNAMRERTIGLPVDFITLDQICRSDQGLMSRLTSFSTRARKFSFPWWEEQCLLAVLIYLRKVDVGVTLQPNEVQRRCPSLQYDSDGLLVGPFGVRFERDAVLFNDVCLRYDVDLRRYPTQLTGGLIEFLIRARRTCSDVNHFGLAIDPFYVAASEHWRRSFTRAFMYGPQALTDAQIRDDGFPEDPTGTTTEHRRIMVDPAIELVHPLAPFVERLQVFWSRRDRVKTVQMEELLRNDAPLLCSRYLHARWDESRETFVHLDGAVRSYDHETYDQRLGGRVSTGREQATRYKKLFRLDATLSLQDVASAAILFFAGSELVGEYFAAAFAADAE